MSRGTNIQIEQRKQSKLIMSQKDYKKVKQWYQSYKMNFFPLNQGLDALDNQLLKQVHFRMYFSQIYLSDQYITRNFNLIKNLAEDGLAIIGGIYNQTQKQLKGKLYESHKLKVSFNFQTKSLILANQMNFFIYSFETKKRDSMFLLQFILTNNQGEQFRLGKIQYNINLSPSFDIAEIGLKDQNSEKTGYIQCIIDKDLIKDIAKYCPTNIIFDQNCKIPPFFNFQMKKKKQNFILKDKVKLSFKNLEIIIQDIQRLKNKILKLNPFSSLHSEKISMKITSFDLILGSHNTWTFLELDKQPNLIPLIQLNQTKLNNHYQQPNQIKDFIILKSLKDQLLKSYFDCDKTVFMAILVVNTSFQYGSLVKKSSQALGWTPILPKLSQFQLKFQSILEIQNEIQGFPLRIKHNKIKIKADIINKKFQLFVKKQDEQVQVSRLFINSMYDIKQQIFILKKTFHLKDTQHNQFETYLQNQIMADPVDKQLKQTISQVQILLGRQNKKIEIKGFIFSQRTNNTQTQNKKQPDWGLLLSLQNKTIKIGAKIASIIPNTDQYTYIKGKYYLPRLFKVKIFIMRKQIQCQCKVQDNQVTFGIPIFLKTKKQMIFIESSIKTLDELVKIRDSSLIISVFDLQKNVFYAKGFYQMSKLLNENDQFKINIQLANQEYKMGHLTLQMFLSVKKIDLNYKRQIQQIPNQKILHSLPLKQRMMMRISNFNKSTNDMHMQAINYFKQKTHQAVIDNITAQQINNQSIIEYEVGQPSYYLIEFTNSSSSQNNLFTLFIKNCYYAQIITNEVQFQKACQKIHLNKKIPFHKINFEIEPQGIKSLQNGYYSCKIIHNQKINIMIKIMLQQWYSRIKQITNFSIDVLRNTIPAKNYKFKIVFKQPIINQFFYFQQFSQNLSNKIINSLVIENLWKKYYQISSFSKWLYISNQRKQFKIQIKQPFKKNQKLKFLIQGKRIHQQKFQNILIEIKIMEGQQIKIQLGDIFQGNIRISSYQHQNLMNNLLILKNNIISQSNTLISFDNKIYLVENQIYKIPFSLSKLEQGLTYIVINFYNLEGTILYQYLLKITARLKFKPIQIFIDNHIGYQFLISCQNRFIQKSKFYLQSNSRALFIERQVFKISKDNIQKISVEVIDKLSGIAYIFLYDDSFKVNQVFQIKMGNQRFQKGFK